MNTISARKILTLTTDHLNRILTGHYLVQFDDATIEMSATDIITSQYAWGAHKKYPTVPLTSDMTIIPYLKHKKYFTKGTMLSLYNKVMWTALDALQGAVTAISLSRDIFTDNMHLYNAMTVLSCKHVYTLDTWDLIAAQEHPLFLALYKKMEDHNHTQDIVQTCTDEAVDILLSGEMVDERGKLLVISRGCIAGIMKPVQASQACFARGNQYDIDNEPISYPLISSVSEGINTVVGHAIYSREGAKAEMTKLDDIRDVAYAGRKLTMVAQRKHRVIFTDCGTSRFISKHIESKKDLSPVIGMYHQVDDKPVLIREEDTHLIGTTINARSPLTCALNAHDVCSKCLGELAHSMIPGVNIGTLISKPFAQKNIQDRLSIKHLLRSSTAVSSTLSPSARSVLTSLGNSFSMLRSERPKCKKVELEIHTLDFPGLKDVIEVKDVQSLILIRISSFDDIRITLHRKMSTVERDINIGENGPSCNLSKEVLGYIHDHPKCVRTRDDKVTITLDDDFNMHHPLIVSPPEIEDIGQKSKEISDLYERRGTGKLMDSDVIGTAHMLVEFLSRIGYIHAGVVELLLSAYISKNGTSTVGTGADGLNTVYHEPLTSLIANNSVSTQLLYGYCSPFLLKSPSTYLRTQRDDALLDAFLTPEAVYNAHKNEPYIDI